MHALQQPFAETIGAHSLLHDFWCDVDHVNLANVAAFDNSDDVLARAEFAFQWLHTENAGIGSSERVKNLLRRSLERPCREIFEKETFADGVVLV